LSEISVPVLVVHGTRDPVLPYPHGEAIVESVPRAKLVTLQDAGHELHRADWPLVIDEIIKHIDAAQPCADQSARPIDSTSGKLVEVS
jgi:pimeloyl-ACP methyl ester carboxylesterase